MEIAFHIGALAALWIGVSPLADQPFGMATVPAPDRAISTIWRGLQSDIQADERTVVLCRVDPGCGSPAALRFIAIVDEAMRHEGRARIGHINRAVNLAITATRSDVQWMSPLKALASPGDCKSYAVTKYMALGAMGIPADDRRPVVVRDTTNPQETHLVAVARIGEEWLILDNRTLTLVESNGRPSYRPLYVLDQSGVQIPIATPVAQGVVG
jgi:predicted transglutaminase-like cysteine proteinase